MDFGCCRLQCWPGPDWTLWKLPALPGKLPRNVMSILLRSKSRHPRGSEYHASQDVSPRSLSHVYTRWNSSHEISFKVPTERISPHIVRICCFDSRSSLANRYQEFQQKLNVVAMHISQPRPTNPSVATALLLSGCPFHKRLYNPA